MGPVEVTQPTLAGMPRVRAPRPVKERAVAATLPVARVCVDVQPAHLDRLFDYLVPEDLDEAALPGDANLTLHGEPRRLAVVAEQLWTPLQFAMSLHGVSQPFCGML